MTEHDYRLIAENIRSHRLQNKLTQEQMADQLGIDPQYYAQLEQGRRHFTIERIVDSCRILSVPIEKIVTIETGQTDHQELLQRISSKIEEADSWKLQLIDKIIKGM